ncbi:MAG: aminopeptidase P family N-terminal domain-containing protein, partial [Thermomicrobiales bacterium]
MSQPAPTPVTDIIDWTIRPAEYADRVRRVRDVLADRGLDALVLFHPNRMAYVSGFFHLSTERPMAIVISARDDRIGGLVPWL